MALDPLTGILSGTAPAQVGTAALQAPPASAADRAAFEAALGQQGPVMAQPAAPIPTVARATGPGTTLGHEVLNSLERFGKHVTTLQRIGVEAGKRNLSPGPAARPVAASPPVPGAAAGPAGQSASSGGAAVDVASIFQVSMAEQARLYGLVTEVSMGRSVAGSVNGTVKTLLTQSG